MNLPLFDCCLPCRGSRDHRPVCIYFPHIASRFPFLPLVVFFPFLWFGCPSSSLLCPFPSSAVQKSLGNGRRESAVWGNGEHGFPSVQRTFPSLIFLECSTFLRNVVVGLHLKLPFTPWLPRGLGSLLGTYGRLLPIGFGPYSRLVSLAITQCLLGPLWAVVLWASPDHVFCLPLGLLQMALVDCLWSAIT